MPADTAGQARTGESEYRRLPVADGSDIGYHDSGHGEAIVLAHAGVFSDWFRLLSLQLPRARYRVVRVRRAGYRDTTPRAGHLALADHPDLATICRCSSRPHSPSSSQNSSAASPRPALRVTT